MATRLTHAIRPPHSLIRAMWQGQTLARRFIIASFVLTSIAMIAHGVWISRILEHKITENAGTAGAAFVARYFAPYLQELSSSRSLSPRIMDSLDNIRQNYGMMVRIRSMKVWLRDGTIVYSSDKELIGKVYSNPNIDLAWHGIVISKLDKMSHEEHAKEWASGLQLLEIYAPIYAESTNEVIAIAEFYEEIDGLEDQLTAVTRQSWLITLHLLGAIVLALLAIVANGSKMIEWQRGTLKRKVLELSDLLEQNRILREREKNVARQVIIDHEHFLHRIGSDLHDGPAQLIGLSLLRLDQGTASGSVRDILTEALAEMRNISAGLSLPDIWNQTLEAAITKIVSDHERRTRALVHLRMSHLPEQPPPYVTQCIYRIVQEGLMNAFKHADGNGQQVIVWSDEQSITVTVRDHGRGSSPNRSESGHSDKHGLTTTSTTAKRQPYYKHMGLIGLRGRIESIGGTLRVSTHPRGGTTLTASLPIVGDC